MVSVDKAVIAHVQKGKERFEVLVDPELALEFRKGKPIGLERVLAINQVFTDSRKGERASAADLQEAFGTADPLKVAEAIIRSGDVQLTTEQRHKMTEEKRKQVVALIVRQGMDPKTKLPHPPQRIENAMAEARVNIDPFRSAEEQMPAIVEKLRPLLPIAIENVEVALRIPAEHAGRCQGYLRGVAQVKKEEWTSSSWIVVIEIPAGLQSDIYAKLNSLTGGQVEAKLLRELK